MISIYKYNEIKDFLKRYDSRRFNTSEEVSAVVRDIIQTVREKGDEALIAFTRQFDHADIEKAGIRVPEDALEAAAQKIPDRFLSILKKSADNIRQFHENEKLSSWIQWREDGVILGQKVTPLERIGIYVPGGRAVYPSSLLMAAVPAQVAGVDEICVVSPPDKEGRIHPSILAAASILGIRHVYKVGGAQAVAALAYGTQKIGPVDKIVGPGNMYVAEAKRQVFGVVDIDMVAGPSEVVILADEAADPDHAASDLLAQAEHDPAASSILITPSAGLAEQIQAAVEKQAKTLKRREILESSLNDFGGILVVKDMNAGVDLVNELAAEHLGLHVKNPWETLAVIRNAGAVFLGSYSPETVGDYWAGPNHILPTNRTARFSSPLGTMDFQKRSSLIQYTKAALSKNAEPIIHFADTEGLDGHANAVKQRIR